MLFSLHLTRSPLAITVAYTESNAHTFAVALAHAIADNTDDTRQRPG
jgi:hypothetical protein